MIDLHIWNRNLENTALLCQLYVRHTLVSQKSLCGLGGPLGCIVPVPPDWWKGWCVCVYEESKFALLNMSPLRWQQCQGKSIFRLNSFDNVPLSVFSPSSKNERTRSEPVEKGFWSLQQCSHFFSFHLLLCSRGKGEKREMVISFPPTPSVYCTGKWETDSTHQIMSACRCPTQLFWSPAALICGIFKIPLQRKVLIISWSSFMASV